MVDKRILRLTLKRVFCPLCGDWHKWEGKTLQSYSENEPYEYDCDGVTLKFWGDDYCIYIQSSDLCYKVNTHIDDKVYMDDIECDLREPQIKFSIMISTQEIVCSDECGYCESCNLPNIGDERDYDEFELNLEFKLEFSSRYFDKYAQSTRDKQKELEEETRREQEFERQREEEAKRQQELVKTHETKKTTKSEENITSANNLFNRNMEFGPNKDENLASTIMGVAVKSGDSWRIYDKKKKEITDVGDMQLSNFPIFILPTTKLTEGDLIKDGGEYYFVTKAATSETQTLSVRTGDVKNIVPIKIFLGLSGYLKVIALSDSLNVDDEKDKLGIENYNMFMYCIMRGNMGFDNLLTNYLILNKLMGKKEDKAPQNTDEEIAE